MEMEAKEKSKAVKRNSYQSENSTIEQSRQKVQKGVAPQKSSKVIISRFNDSQVSITNLSPNVKKPSLKNLALPIENSHPKNWNRRMSVAPV